MYPGGASVVHSAVHLSVGVCVYIAGRRGVHASSAAVITLAADDDAAVIATPRWPRS